MAVASGSKALMFFQSYNEQLSKQDNGKAAQQIGAVVKSVKAVGSVIREGDIGGMSFKTDTAIGDGGKVLVEVIRSATQLLVVLVNTNADGYSNLLCHTVVLDRHWTFKRTTVKSVSLDMASAPDLGKVSNWREAKDGALTPLSGVRVDATGGEVKLSDIQLAADVPVRFLVADTTAA